MNLKLYCMYDIKAKTVTPPFCSPNDDVAKRDFCFATLASRIPMEDQILWCVGQFLADDSNQEAFELKAFDSPRVVPVSVELQEAYAKVYTRMNPNEALDDDYEEFCKSGVINER